MSCATCTTDPAAGRDHSKGDTCCASCAALEGLVHFQRLEEVCKTPYATYRLWASGDEMAAEIGREKDDLEEERARLDRAWIKQTRIRRRRARIPTGACAVVPTGMGNRHALTDARACQSTDAQRAGDPQWLDEHVLQLRRRAQQASNRGPRRAAVAPPGNPIARALLQMPAGDEGGAGVGPPGGEPPCLNCLCCKCLCVKYVPAGVGESLPGFMSELDPIIPDPGPDTSELERDLEKLRDGADAELPISPVPAEQATETCGGECADPCICVVGVESQSAAHAVEEPVCATPGRGGAATAQHQQDSELMGDASQDRGSVHMDTRRRRGRG